jgi:cytidyltransferase-like protein
MQRKVFVSGIFDLLHSGHIAFLETASRYGDLYVSIGSDHTMFDLKGRPPLICEDERLYMVKALRCVKDAFISRGTGILDFEAELRGMQPDLFIVNEDGNLPAKRKLCAELRIDYLVLHRTPPAGLTPRSSSDMRGIVTMPFRVDLAGGWLDQPFVSQIHPGPMLTVSIHPTVDFNDRSGMASSTRRKAIELWGPRLPADEPERLAKMLFAYDNPPGTRYISGAQDTIGIVYPGLAYHYYDSAYWPKRIQVVQDEDVLKFIEDSLYLIPLGPRGAEYDVLSQTCITVENARALAEAAEGCWEAVLRKDRQAFGTCFKRSFESQVAMFPLMMNEMVAGMIEQYRNRALGWKLSGAGGGGYLTLVSDQPIEQAIRINIRRKSD